MEGGLRQKVKKVECSEPVVVPTSAAAGGRSDRWSVATPGRNDGAAEAMEAARVN